MKFFARLTAWMLLTCGLANVSVAQTKVFKEVSEDIASTMRPIVQDNSLVGYLVFTRLEAVNEDSFAYRITIMDENLNDIGLVNFREEDIHLADVSFEQDILCLAYVKSNFNGKKFKSKKAFTKAKEEAENYVVTQFINLEGKILKTNTEKVSLSTNEYYPSFVSNVGAVYFKQGVLVTNIPQKGFVVFYGDEKKNYLSVYTPQGEKLWTKNPTNNPKRYYLRTTPNDIYAITYKPGDTNAEYNLTGFSVADGSSYETMPLKDKKGNILRAMTFENDLSSGNLYVSGYIVNGRKDPPADLRSMANSPYAGVFTININGTTKSEYKPNYSYWIDGNNSALSESGRLPDTKEFTYFERSFRDFQGNTYFAGTAIKRKTKIGSIISSVVFLPFLLPTIVIAAGGYTKYKATDAVLLKQNTKGQISIDNTIPVNQSGYRKPFWPAGDILNKSFYVVTNSNTKNNYLVIDDVKDIVIYNLQTRKIVRTIPHKDGNVRTYVFPAKDGSIMVSEYNKKERYSKYSIESL